MHVLLEYEVMKNILKRLRTKDYIMWEVLSLTLVSTRLEFYDL